MGKVKVWPSSAFGLCDIPTAMSIFVHQYQEGLSSISAVDPALCPLLHTKTGVLAERALHSLREPPSRESDLAIRTDL